MKNNNLDQRTINQLLKKVKSNKKYKSISDSIVRKEIKDFYKRFGSHLNYEKSEKEFVKRIRAKLHVFYGSYQTKKKRKKWVYLTELENITNKKTLSPEISKIINKLLSLTLSTKERLNDYPTIYKNIFSLTGKPKIIIDLGAGLNPLSIPFMRLRQLTYYAYDIDLADIEFLNDYFNIIKTKYKINGKAEILDVTNLSKIKNLPESDIILMFKLIDIIDSKSKKQRKISEDLIKILIKKTKFIVSSFPTKTLSGKPMSLPVRRGFELMLERNNLSFKTIKTNNEVFYVVFQ